MSTEEFSRETTGEQVAEKFASNIKGKVVLITGSTWGGIGGETARILAKYDAGLIIITGRSKQKLQETIDKIKQEIPSANLRGLVLDLSSQNDVRRAAKEVLEYPEPHIDVLICNAGIMGPPYSITVEGIESQLAVNHISHFLFTNLILKKKILNGNPFPPRIVVVSSAGHQSAPVIFDDIDFSNGKKYTPQIGYGQSKTANILFSKELNKRYHSSHGLVTFSLHPGAIDTNLQQYRGDLKEFVENPPLNYWGKPIVNKDFFKNRFVKTLSQGSATTLVAAFDDGIESNSGSYLDNCQISDHLCADYAKDDESAEKLWGLSEELVGERFPIL